ncbi:type IV pilin-like G/H family protein [Nostoc sp. UHCC 0302]|uniref:type IV pilin-like G/H family protein n=1 Tax=Nostoc sp. UHCC 0302 TaxID=3134896 RepID=UPI00311CC5BC
MTQPNLLELAKQGDAQAIASLMNRQLQPKGIKVKTNLTSGCFMVIAESENVPEQSFLVDFICKGITELKAEVIKRVVIHGRVSGNNTSVWRESFEIKSDLTVQQEQLEFINSLPVTSHKSKNKISIIDRLTSFLRVVKDAREVINIILLLSIFLTLTANLFINNKSRPTLWEYKVESIDDAAFDAAMHRIGAEGWELTSARRAISGEGSSSRGLYEVIFKRPATKAKIRENSEKLKVEAKESLLQSTQLLAKIGIGSINRAQQANYLEKMTFANTIEELGLSLKLETENYVYNITTDSSSSFVTATAKIDELKSYVGAVFLVLENGETTTVAVRCETNAPSKISPKSPQLNVKQPVCPAGLSEVD